MVESEATARTVLDLALADPAAAHAEATRLLDRGLAPPDTAVALRARGLASRLLGDLSGSIIDLTDATERAEALDDNQLRAGIGITMAGTLMAQGRPPEAKIVLAECISIARGLERVEALFQLGTTHAQAGELDAALTIYKQTLPQIRRHGRKDWEAQLVGNRGIIRIHTGDYAGAVRDLDTAVAIQLADGSPAQAALNLHNKAQALYMQGHLAASLDTYATAEGMQEELGMPILMHAQKCEAYLAAGMFEETMSLAQAAYTFHRGAGTAMGAILSLLPGAEAAMALGHDGLALKMAERSRSISAGNFPAWSARAQLSMIEARSRLGTIDSTHINEATSLYASVVRSDSVTAARALLLATRIAIQLNDWPQAIELVADASSIVRRCPLHVQIERWQLVGETRLAVGNRSGTLRAVRAGFAAFDRLLTGLSAYDVRARTLRHVEALAEMGIGAFLDAGRLGDAVALTERLRGAALRIGADSNAEAQELLRAETALRRGQGSGSRLLEAQRSAEQQGPTPSSRELGSDETLLTYVDVAGRVQCISSTVDGHILHDCGDTNLINEQLDEQELVYRQLARRSRLSKAVGAQLVSRATDVNHILTASLVPPIATERVLINPSSNTRRTMWGALDGLFARTHTIILDLDMARRRLPRSVKRAVVVGSSELAHVASELDHVALAHGSSPVLDPTDLLETLEGSDLLHVAGHFSDNNTNPLFSELPLGTFRLRGNEVLSLRHPPTIAVLSACTTGAVDALGGAPFGFSTALLASGCAAVVVTQSPIEDGDAVVGVMARFHKALAGGATPGDALRATRLHASNDERPVAMALSVMGTGW